MSMAREIKFRGWDSENRKYVYWTLTDLLVRFGEPEYQFGVKGRPSPFFNWEEYIGLDKNGKDIYEGDIVKVAYFGGYTIKNALVYWDNGAFYVDDKLPPGNMPISHFFEKTINDIEVIGNIYENFELLKNDTD